MNNYCAVLTDAELMEFLMTDGDDCKQRSIRPIYSAKNLVRSIRAGDISYGSRARPGDDKLDSDKFFNYWFALNYCQGCSRYKGDYPEWK